MHKALIVAFALCSMLAGASVQAKDVITWYDDEENEHSITMHEPGPLERRVIEEKISRERNIPSDAVPAISEDADATSARLQKQYEGIKDARDIELHKERLRAQLQALEERSDAIDREMHEISQEISHKNYRRNRIFSRNKNMRIHLAYEINQLEITLEHLADMKKDVEVKKHAITTQLDSL